jgi:hypothetical protein
VAAEPHRSIIEGRSDEEESRPGPALEIGEIDLVKHQSLRPIEVHLDLVRLPGRVRGGHEGFEPLGVAFPDESLKGDLWTRRRQGEGGQGQQVECEQGTADDTLAPLP